MYSANTSHFSDQLRLLIVLSKFIKGTNCFKFLKRRLPSSCTKRLDELANLKCKIASEKVKLEFYKTCISTHIFPRHLYKFLRSNKLQPNVSNLLRLAKSHKEKCNDMLNKLIELHTQASCVLSNLSLLCRIKFMNFCSTVVAKTNHTTKQKLSKTLVYDNDGNLFQFNPDKYVSNLSTVRLSVFEKEALSLGFNFSVAHTKISDLSIDAQFESLYDQLNPLVPTTLDKKNWLKVKLVDVAHHFHGSQVRQRSILTPKHFAALKNLQCRSDIVILRPDKGSGVVVINKCEYKDKMLSILGDQSKFLQDVSSNINVRKLESRVKSNLLKLLKMNVINNEEFNILKPSGSVLPNLYGLPKIHKPNIPLRPILSMRGSPTHELAKWLVKLLNPIRANLCKFSLKDTFELIDFLGDINIKDKSLHSFDVNSLFTNVPLTKTVDFLCDYISKNFPLFPIPSPFLKDLLLLCTANVQFTFEGEYFRQVDGVAMGSPLGPLLAEVFMSYVENMTSDLIGETTLYRRYMDDILIICDKHFDVYRLLDKLNGVQNDIVMTHEPESNGQLAFLDILLSRRDDGTIRRRLPSSCTKRLDELANLKCKIASEKVKLEFYKTCISTHIFPRHLYKFLRSNKLQPNVSNLLRLAKSHKEKCNDMLNKLIELHTQASCVLSNLSLLCRIKFMNFCSTVVAKTNHTTKQKLSKTLVYDNDGNLFQFNPDKYVSNLSTVRLSVFEKEALSLGFNFSVAHTKISDLSIDAQFESLYDQLNPLVPTTLDKKNWLKVKLVDVAHHFHGSQVRQRSILTPKHFAALKNLQCRSDIVILRPDKGSGVVVINKCEYKDKMLSILGDQSKFLQDVSSNINVRKLESRVKSNLLKLLKMNVINNEEFNILKPSGSVLPNLYGLPKIHKPNIPLRPILSMRGSPTHELAKWLVKLLNPIRANLCKFSLKDTFELIDFLGDINIKDKSLHSFDVNSLFTNVPLTKTVDFLCDYISKNFPLFPIPSPFLKDLLLLCTANVQFTFEGEYFRQVDGVAMGSPLGPLLAEVFMSYVENMTSDLIGETTLYRRYMDDILIICDKHFDVYRLLDKLNGVQNDIVMTHEPESNGQLAFLDILLSRRDDGTIRRRLPSSCTKRLDELANLKCKIASEKVKLEFYKTCISTHIFPRHLYKFLRSNKLQPNVSNLLRLAKSHKEKCNDMLNKLIELHTQASCVLSNLSLLCRIKFMNFCSTVVAKTNHTTKQKLSKTLVYDNDGNLFQFNPDKYVSNLSTVRLSVFEKEALSLGFNFSVAHTKISDLSIDAQFESLYDQLNPLVPTTLDKKNWLKVKLVDVAHHFHGSQVRQRSILTPKHFAALKNLQCRSDIVILRPDKGSGVVVINKCEYKDKMLSILGDQSKFLQDVSSNINVRKLESRVKSNLLKLLKMNVINNEEFNILKPSGSVLPNLYGLPKIHKPNIPLRPILSMRGSPTHELAKWLVKLLNPIRANLCKFSLKDTFELIDFLGDINIKDKSLHSFDVNSLFTNVPLTKTVDFLCDYISKNFPLFPIPSPFLKDLLLLCTANVQFTFEGEYFRQVDGVAMGSPLGPLLAEVFMSYVENMTSDLIGETTLYRRYMDDILIICDKHFDVYRLLDKLNGVQNDIVMTHEPESNGQLAFLDILLSRRDDGTIRRRLPSSCTKRLDELANLKCKIASEKVKLEFYKTCISTHIFPRHLYKFLRSNKLQPNVSNLLRLAKSHKEKCNDMLNKLIELHTQASCVLSNLSLLCRIKFMNFCSTVVAKTNHTTKQKLSKTLVYDNDGNLFQFNPDKYVSNLSTVRLSVFEKEALSLGFNFSVAHTKISDLSIDAQFESLYDQLNPLVPTTLDKKNWLKVKLVDVAHHFHGSQVRQRSILTPKHFAALKNLQCRSDIVILRPDKGSGVVVINKCEYKDKMLSILGDQSKFLQDVSSNINVRKLESRVKSNLLKLLKMNVINNEEFNILKPSGSVLPNLYGLPKIHKPNIPLRPILSMRGSPTHELAKWLVKLLNPIRANLCKFSLKDTFELIDFLGDINIKDKSLHSFDVNSLFTNVPLTKTVDFLCDYISKNFPLFPIPSPFLKDLLLLCTANVQFTFEGEYFRQVDGVAMGSPLGPLLAEVFMSYVENMTSDLIGETTLYRRYMDDILIICDKHFDVYRLLDKLNGVQNDIVMTHEPESNGQLAFLDILLSRRDDGTIRRYLLCYNKLSMDFKFSYM
uniref:Reverse transcriptase domain-containing protein n=1 Tax=Schistosoma mansoni TaxID=6183 RepID=A0A5K4F1X7_SCHMA